MKNAISNFILVTVFVTSLIIHFQIISLYSERNTNLDYFLVGFGIVAQIVGYVLFVASIKMKYLFAEHNISNTSILIYGIVAIGIGIMAVWHGLLHGGEYYVPFLR